MKKIFKAILILIGFFIVIFTISYICQIIIISKSENRIHSHVTPEFYILLSLIREYTEENEGRYPAELDQLRDRYEIRFGGKDSDSLSFSKLEEMYILLCGKYTQSDREVPLIAEYPEENEEGIIIAYNKESVIDIKWVKDKSLLDKVREAR